jgi:hypothetical protein
MSTTTRLTELTASEWRRQSGSKLPLPNERFAFLIRRRGQNGRILRHSRAMNGSAGLSPSRNRKPEGSTLSAYARNLKKERAGLLLARLPSPLNDGVLLFDIFFSLLPRRAPLFPIA